MGDEVVAGPVIGDEGPEFGVLQGNLLDPGTLFENGPHLSGIRIGTEAEDALDLALAEVAFHAADQSVVGGLCRIGNEAENGGVEVVLDGFEDAGHQGLSQGDPLAVDVGVVAAGEIDPLEAAGRPLTWCADFRDLTVTVAVDDERFSWLELFDVGRHGVEGGLDDRPFGGGHDHLVILVPEARADAVRIAGDERVATADDAAHHVAAVPVDGGPTQDVGHIELICDEAADFCVFVAGILELPEGLFDLFVEEVAHLLEHGHRVGLLLGVLAEFHEDVEQLVDVGQVEVSSEGEGPGAPVVLPKEGVDALDGVAPVGAVAEVSQEDFAREGAVLLEPIGILEALRMVFLGVGKPAHDLREEVLNRLLGCGAGSAEVAFAGGDVNLDVGQAHTVLSPVPLLLHQQVHLV